MSTTPKGKKVKAWAVMMHGILYAVFPTERIAEIEREKLEYPDGKHRAFNPYPGISIVPCTITYTLPTIKSRKP